MRYGVDFNHEAIRGTSPHDAARKKDERSLAFSRGRLHPVEHYHKVFKKILGSFDPDDKWPGSTFVVCKKDEQEAT